MPVNTPQSWTSPIVHYLLFDELPEDKLEARKIKFRAARYVLHDGLLYHRGNSAPLLRYVTEAKAVEILKEIHE